MEKLRIVTPQRLQDDLHAAVRIPIEISAFPEGAADTEVAGLTAGAQVFIGAEFKAAWTSSSLRLVQVPGAGTDGIDRSSLPEGCKICNVFGHERAVAEHSFLLMLALHKELFSLDRNLRQGKWRWERRMTPELRNRALLIVGLGRIGQELARWGHFFSMNVMGVNRTLSQDLAESLRLSESGTLQDLRRLLPLADFVVVALPATPDTQGLIDARELALMKPSSYLINVGRAPVVNEPALYDALRERKIAGAGLDVWYQYPRPGEDSQPSGLPFSELENVIMTPHNGGLTPETMAQRWKDIAGNLERMASGRDVLNVVWTVRVSVSLQV